MEFIIRKEELVSYWHLQIVTAGDVEDIKSTSRYMFFMNSSAVSWC